MPAVVSIQQYMLLVVNKTFALDELHVRSLEQKGIGIDATCLYYTHW